MFGEESMAHVPVLDVLETALPTDFNWQHNRSVITPVKNQSTCGGSVAAPAFDSSQCCSCYAFSVTENVESVWALAGHPLARLAVQQVRYHCCNHDSPR